MSRKRIISMLGSSYVLHRKLPCGCEILENHLTDFLGAMHYECQVSPCCDNVHATTWYTVMSTDLAKVRTHARFYVHMAHVSRRLDTLGIDVKDEDWERVSSLLDALS